MSKQHHYTLTIQWTGNKGEGTKDYTAYDRSHQIVVEGKNAIEGSSDPAFRGDKSKHNPEDLFIASISSCHMLWYLHLCAEAGVIVLTYKDDVKGLMELDSSGGGRFTNVTLHPEVVVKDSSMIQLAFDLHHEANLLCFIANSCNFPIQHQAVCKAQ